MLNRRTLPQPPQTDPSNRTRLAQAATCLFGSLLAALAHGAPPTSRGDALTEEAVDAAVIRAVNWIKARQNDEGTWDAGDNKQARYWAGDTALAVLALLYAGEDPRQEYLRKPIDWLADQKLNATYTYAVRAHALALVPTRKYNERLDNDLQWLVQAIAPRNSPIAGAYDYESLRGAANTTTFDNSNSQFGVLGAWMATEAGARTANLRNYWQLVEEHWLGAQRDDGGWSYRNEDRSTGSMTVAGLATLYVVLDRLHAGSGFRRAKDVLGAIDKAMGWIGSEFTPNNPYGDSQWRYYYLYGVERAGRASGRKYFRRTDWFRDGAVALIADQHENGSWPGTGLANDLHNTCFALMFLCHGRAPLLFNKLDYGGDWQYYLRDLASLTRYAERSFERLFNWQIVELSGSMDDLLEAPILYLAAHDKVELDDAQQDKLREYVARGGLILAMPQDAKPPVIEKLKTLGKTLFPAATLQRLPDDHPLFNGQVQFPIEKPPEIWEVRAEHRPLMLICAEDVSRAWNEDEVARKTELFQLGCNFYVYATDKNTPRTRFETPAIPLVKQVEIRRTIKVARIKYDGDWDIEPRGWDRLTAYLNNTASTRLVVEKGVALDSAKLRDFQIAHITGDEAFKLSEAERAGLKEFFSAGGTLIADAAASSAEFTESLERELKVVLPGEPRVIPSSAPILDGDGLADAVDLKGISYRRESRVSGDLRTYPKLIGVEFGNRFAAIYSPLDISTGLLGTPVWGLRGYEGRSALHLMRNLLLYADLTRAEKAQVHRNLLP